MVREKYRYVVIRVTTTNKGPFNTNQLLKEIIETATNYLTDHQFSITIPKLIIADYWPYNRIVILKILRSGIPHISSLLEQIATVSNVSCTIKHIYTSGIIKKAKQWVIRTEKRNRNKGIASNKPKPSSARPDWSSIV
ncbi:ribonuclease P/MRP protein subunit POP5 [Nematocida sp. AWRm80]|nr:ribonuclease P/MRP protein subunit POP5 [Nematocida sp. AWRm80]